jgi:hypothetical protein
MEEDATLVSGGGGGGGGGDGLSATGQHQPSMPKTNGAAASVSVSFLAGMKTRQLVALARYPSIPVEGRQLLRRGRATRAVSDVLRCVLCCTRDMR